MTFLNVKKHELDFLVSELAYKEIPKKNDYEVLRLNGETTIILYTSGKLLIQGKAEKVKEVEDLFSNKLKAPIRNNTNNFIGYHFDDNFPSYVKDDYIIGSDESLKGDTFGGIIVAAVKANRQQHQDLIELGVGDSKKLSETNIKNLAQEIKKSYQYKIIELHPEEYNKYKVTDLLNKLHKDSAKALEPGFHIVDEYPGCNIANKRLTKAESYFPEVAAASILARAKALDQIEELSAKLGIKIPLGSTHVKEALIFLKNSSKNPNEYVKISFKNVQNIFRV